LAPIPFQVALLDGRELRVDDDELGLRFLHALRDLRHLAGADQRGGLGRGDGGDDRFHDFEIDGERQAHRLLQPRLNRAIGGDGGIAVPPVHMEDDGAGHLRAFDLEVDAAAASRLAVLCQPPACSSSKRLMGPPGMMVEMACL
jgi:hypothetical protein